MIDESFLLSKGGGTQLYRYQLDSPKKEEGERMMGDVKAANCWRRLVLQLVLGSVDSL